MRRRRPRRPAWVATKSPANQRRRRDSNPRIPCEIAGFQNRCLKPLGHSSRACFVAVSPSDGDLQPPSNPSSDTSSDNSGGAAAELNVYHPPAVLRFGGVDGG